MIGFRSVYQQQLLLSGCACLIPVYGWLERPSSGKDGFYHHESSWCSGPRLWNCIKLWSTGDWPSWTLDLLMMDVPDLVWVTVIAPLASSDHSSLSAVISIAKAIPNLCVSRRVLPKHRVNRTAVCDAIGELPWRSIWNTDNPVKRLNMHFLC